MEKGARLSSLFQNLEKLSSRESSALIPGAASEESQQIRHLVSRILQCVVGQEKPSRDTILKNSDYIDRLLYLLEHYKDQTTALNIIYILTELVGRINIGKRAAVLVSHGATPVLLRVLVYEGKQSGSSEDLLIALHQLIAKVGPKDRKFCIKARLYQALGVSLNLLHSYNLQPRILLPVIQVLKLYSADVVNASYLGKHGAVALLFKVFSLCQRKQFLLLKLSLDTLSLLVKSKSNAVRAIRQDGVSVLLGMFSDWHRIDSKNRHVGLRRAILSVLKNLTNQKLGQEAVVEADGIQLLYSACQVTVDSREVELLIYMASIIMRKCFPQSHLPIASLRNPLIFQLPDNEAEESSHQTETIQTEEVSYESSVDNEDDVSSDEEQEIQKRGSGGDSDDETEVSLAYDTSYKRSAEDLVMYQPFFSELNEFDALAESETSMNMKNNNNTASVLVNDLPSKHCCRSYPDLQQNLSFPVIGIKWNGASMTEANRYVCKMLQQKDVGNSKLCSPYRSAPDSLQSESRVLSECANRKESAGPFWTIPVVHVGDASPKTSKKGFPRSPKVKHKILGKTVNGKVKEKKPSKNRRGSKSSGDDWLSFDLSKVMSTLTSSSGIRGDGSLLVPETKSGSAVSDDDEDDDDLLASILMDVDEGIQQKVDDPEAFAKLAADTVSVGVFNKLAYPELYGHCVPPFSEPLYEKKLGVQRELIFEDIDRFLNPEQVIDRVVYDLDALLVTYGHPPRKCLGNDDEMRVSSKECFSDALMFNSRFESGNLRKAVQIRQYEYDLILNPDINSNRFHQWFYFEVSNMEAGVPYRFNIINCEKVNSQFNFGMRPVVFSVAEAIQGRPYWFRAGNKISYYKNHFARSSQTTGGLRGKTYFTATFTIIFRHERDVCYIAYHYPYTYTTLQYHLKKWEKAATSDSLFFSNQTLCKTVGGNDVPLLTITSHPVCYDKEGILQLKNRPYIFLSSRVHPGESNASWVMKGTIDFLLSDHSVAKMLRQTYIFKIVPMLNPDGVINGNHRCSLMADDLNRRWFCPSPKRHPTVYHTKGLLQYLALQDRAPFVFCDYHGHSRRKNVFLYGCSPTMSWMEEDLDNPTILPNHTEDLSYKTLPRILHNLAPVFSINNCSYAVEKAKETTARVVVWRQLRVVRSYTMESTYCGCDQGIYRGKHINPLHLEVMGQKFVEALAKLKVKPSQTNAATLTSNADANGEVPLNRFSTTGLERSTVSLQHSNCSTESMQSNGDHEDDEDDDDHSDVQDDEALEDEHFL